MPYDPSSSVSPARRCGGLAADRGLAEQLMAAAMEAIGVVALIGQQYIATRHPGGAVLPALAG